MAEWDHLVWAELAGERLLVGEIRASESRDLVRHRFPGRDGAEHRDTGAQEGKWTVEAHFHDYQGVEYFDAFRAVRDAMNDAEIVTWVHPHGDRRQVRIERIDSVTNPDGARYVKATIELVEDTPITATFLAEARGLEALAQDFDAAVLEVEEALEALQAEGVALGL